MTNTQKFRKRHSPASRRPIASTALLPAKADKEGFARRPSYPRGCSSGRDPRREPSEGAQKPSVHQENMQAAISGEDEEWEKMYQEIIETAKGEGNKAAEMSFHYANEVEKIHSRL